MTLEQVIAAGRDARGIAQRHVQSSSSRCDAVGVGAHKLLDRIDASGQKSREPEMIGAGGPTSLRRPASPGSLIGRNLTASP